MHLKCNLMAKGALVNLENVNKTVVVLPLE